MSNDPLRGCPTCGTKVADVQLGLRDYRWVSGLLPGRVAPMDVDFLLERNGHVLILEFKPANVGVTVGQRMTFRTMVGLGVDVWVVHGDGPEVTVDVEGTKMKTTVEELARAVVQWYEEASR